MEVRDSYLSVGKNAAFENKTTRQETSRMRSSPAGTANAMFINMEKKCGLCLEDHEKENCRKYSDPEERKNILKKYGRCFVCLNRNHRSFECRSKIRCSVCKAKHRVSMCNFHSRPKSDFIGASKDTPPKPSASYHHCSPNLTPWHIPGWWEAQVLGVELPFRQHWQM